MSHGLKVRQRLGLMRGDQYATQVTTSDIILL